MASRFAPVHRGDLVDYLGFRWEVRAVDQVVDAYRFATDWLRLTRTEIGTSSTGRQTRKRIEERVARHQVKLAGRQLSMFGGPDDDR